MEGGLSDSLFQMPAETEEVVDVPDPSSLMRVKSIRINRGGAVSVQSLGQ